MDNLHTSSDKDAKFETVLVATGWHHNDVRKKLDDLFQKHAPELAGLKRAGREKAWEAWIVGEGPRVRRIPPEQPVLGDLDARALAGLRDRLDALAVKLEPLAEVTVFGDHDLVEDAIITACTWRLEVEKVLAWRDAEETPVAREQEVRTTSGRASTCERPQKIALAHGNYPEDERLLVTSKELSRALGISPRQVLRCIEHNRLPVAMQGKPHRINVLDAR